jgi:hypothetical protein
MAMASRDELKRKQRILIEKTRTKRYLKLKLHDVDTSILEAVFSRGDEALGRVILDAWKEGARFDAWDESFNPDVWDSALRKNNIKKENYLRKYHDEERLSWDFIDVHST